MSAKISFADSYIPEPNSGCWLWTRTLAPRGYGSVVIRDVTHRAHRVSWEMHRGPIPNGLHVLHKCDVRLCVNPDHLFLGTNADNVADRIAKGRSAANYGDENGRSKLSAATIPAIKSDARPHRVIAGEYGVARSTISRIKRNELWVNRHD
jgi:hypothetical protein